MPTFFQFHQGNESRTRLPAHDSSPLLGRFRAVPPGPGLGLGRRRSSQLGLLSQPSGRGSVHVGYGALVAANLGHDGRDIDGRDIDHEDEDEHDGNLRSRWWRKTVHWCIDLWVEPKQGAVTRVLDVWWSRYGLLVVLPAAMAVAWCAVPFPQYSLAEDTDRDPELGHGAPGHGAARVRVNFWFFLLVYYSFYNYTALIWITKVFNLYNLNWWPQSLGFPLTFLLIALFSLAIPIPIYLSPHTRFLTIHNTAWISWTFIVMAVPVATAFFILMSNERHLYSRTSLSETQRIFTSSWWTTSGDTISEPPRRPDRRRDLSSETFADPDDVAGFSIADSAAGRVGRGAAPRGRQGSRWFPASFVRFLWFCVALFVGLMAYVIGEAYAEIYLRTLPHDNLETILYVYSWVATVHLLDALTGWILGIREGERVGSYPLSWVFKLYFMLTYQTYVRALYARLRSPTQFILLQALSSTSLIILTPLMMHPLYHRVMTLFNMTDQSYPSYQKLCLRNVFIRTLAENTSMAAFLGSILVLHFGANKNVYPYFAFDDPDDKYNFKLTFYASSVTWGCELAAGLVVRGLIAWFYGVDVGLEGKLDLAVWPELLPTSVAVMLHVLQNMLFSIIRLQFLW